MLLVSILTKKARHWQVKISEKQEALSCRGLAAAQPGRERAVQHLHFSDGEQAHQAQKGE